MMKIRESIVPGWSEEPEGYVYPPALEGTAFKPWGFDPMCGSALDMLDWAGFDCLVETDAPGEVQVRAAFASAGHSHTNHVADAPLTAFEQPESMANIWRFVRSVRGMGARVIAMVEPCEAEAMVAAVEAPDGDTVRVTLRDGRVQTLWAEGLDGGAPVLHFTEGDGEETLSGRA